MITMDALPIPADHPAYDGHFPGAPILPGVVLLDAAMHALERASAAPVAHWQVLAAKFHSGVRPGDSLTLEYESLPNGSVRFAIRTAGQIAASGTLRPSAATDGRSDG